MQDEQKCKKLPTRTEMCVRWVGGQQYETQASRDGRSVAPMRVTVEIPDELVSGLEVGAVRQAILSAVVTAVQLKVVMDENSRGGDNGSREVAPPAEPPHKAPEEPVRQLLRVIEVARILEISRALAYEMITSGEIKSVRIRSAVRVPREELERLIREGVPG